jgi:hypothetical protein
MGGRSKSASGELEEGPQPGLPASYGRDGLPDRFRDTSRSLVAFVLLPRPEKAPQAILVAPGHDVDVQVRHTLAHAVIDRNERALGAHRQLHRPSQQPCIAKQRSDKLLGQVPESLEMPARDEQGMAGKQRPVVQKGRARGVFPYEVGGHRALENLTKPASVAHGESSSRRTTKSHRRGATGSTESTLTTSSRNT